MNEPLVLKSSRSDIRLEHYNAQDDFEVNQVNALHYLNTLRH